MTEQSGIKETKELIIALKEGVKAGKKVRDIIKEHGANVSALPQAFELIKEQIALADVYSEGFKDINLIKEELKDLSKEELIELFMELVTAINEIEKA